MKLLQLLFRVRISLTSKIRIHWFRLMGAKIASRSWFGRISIPRNWSDINLGNCGLDDGVVLLCSGLTKSGKLRISSGTYVNRYTIIDAHESVEIGTDCMIGPSCFITDGDHGMSLGIPVGQQPMVTARVVLEEGVWLGAGVKVLKGVTIGRHAVVGAGAVVTRDIPENSISAGVPARVIGMRP